MAPLTWRNVDAPDFTRASSILNQAVGNWAGGFNGASDALDKARTNQKSNRSSELIDDLARIKGEAGVDPFLDQLSGQINPRDMTEELQAAILGLRQTGMGYDSERLNQANTRARTASTNAASGRAASTHAREEAERRALQGLAPEMARLRAGVNNGLTELPGSVAAGAPFTPTGGDYSLGADDGAPPGSGGSFSIDPTANATSAEAIMSTFGEGPQVRNNPGTNIQDEAARLIAENPGVNIAQWLTFMDNNQSQFNTSATNLDENRNRDFEFAVTATDRAREDQARADRQEGAIIAQEAALNSFTDEEAQFGILHSGKSPEVVNAALEALSQQPEGSIGALPPGTELKIEGLADAELVTTSFVNEVQSTLMDDEGIRILTRAEDTYGVIEGPLGQALVTNSGVADSEGRSLEAIQLVAAEAKISEAKAAAYLESTVRRGNKLLGGAGFIWGENGKQIWLDTDAAIAKAKDLETPEKRQAAVIEKANAAQKVAAAQQLQSDMQNIGMEIGFRESRGQDTAALEKKLEAKRSQINKIFTDNPVKARPEADDAANLTNAARPGSGAVDGRPGGETPVEQAADAARDVLTEVTGLDPEQIASLNIADLIFMIEQVESTIPPGSAAAQELAVIKEGLGMERAPIQAGGVAPQPFSGTGNNAAAILDRASR